MTKELKGWSCDLSDEKILSRIGNEKSKYTIHKKGNIEIHVEHYLNKNKAMKKRATIKKDGVWLEGNFTGPALAISSLTN